MLFVLRTLGQSCSNFFYTKTYEQADFSRQTLDSVAYGILDCNDLISIGFIVKGNFTILQFERYIYGDLWPDDIGFVREVILIKIEKDIVVESYFLPCDWAEVPITVAIAHSTERILYRNGLNIKKLKWTVLEPSVISSGVEKKQGRLIIPPRIQTDYRYNAPKNFGQQVKQEMDKY